MTKPRLDVEALCAALEQQRRTRKLSWRQLAAEAGVGASTLSRMTAQGKRPDVDSFAALVDWLGVPADTFLQISSPSETTKRETLAVLSTHLRAGSTLSPDTVDALQDLLGAVERLMDSRGKAPGDGE